MICLKCGSENKGGVKFCGACGAKFLVLCPQCNTENPLDNKFCNECGQTLSSPQGTGQIVSPPEISPLESPPSKPIPRTFASNRYQIKEFLGEGGKKRVYKAYDTLLDRDVALALIKTEGVDKESMIRITREAQAMGRLGAHPNIVTVFDLGKDQDQPYIVTELMGGGDVDSIMAKAENHRLSIDQVLDIAESVCKGLAYAHGKGVIHRDLKPGNVWITEEGITKIGDFGLALVEDRTRLTGQGLMLGTVSYMAPEQATGGQVTVQTDLYALGAMLYEMTTGRPPFIGDDPVAIIGQHLNTNPVSPSWHNPDIPAHLEAIILRCLEKDPLNRPKSVTEVMQTLNSTQGTQVTPETITPDHKSPLYRRVFVGREKEIKTLQTAFDRALSGEGSIMMVVGEPGIGKTALCEQTATYVGLRGGLVLIGHCYEKGSLSLPYLPFIEALRSYVLHKDDEELKSELGSGATYVGRIISEVKERFALELPPPGDPEEDRYRLFESVTGFLKNASTVKPIMLILEDLHDADKGTLDLLNHLARHLSGSRLLIIGNYRDVEVDRTHPLSAALAELIRGSLVGRILLRGLTADELQRMLSQITGTEVPWSLSEAIYRQTEGNPLFVQEVTRYLVEEGLLSKDKPTEAKVMMSIPEGLRDVIGKRLSALSSDCNRVLSIASVIGREFDLLVLQQIAGLSEEEFYKVIEEAQSAALIEERPQITRTIRYRFTHAFFRQTLYEEIIAPRRIRLHQQVARALEEVYKNRLEEHAAELAEHFSYSSDIEDLKKAVGYSEMAAQRATSVFDFGEAVRLLEKALQVQEVLDPEDKTRHCDLLLALGEALIMAGNPRRAFDHELEKAFQLAEETGSKPLTAKACVLSMTAMRFYYWGRASFSPEMVKWVERADRYAEPGTAERVKADINLGIVKTSNQYNEPFESWTFYFDRALDLARKLNDPETFWEVAEGYLVRVWSPDHAEKLLELADEVLLRSHSGVNIREYAYAIGYAAFVFLGLAYYEKFKDTVNIIRQIATRSNQIHTKIGWLCWEIVLKTLEGDLSQAVEKSHELADLGGKESLVEFVDVGINTVLFIPLQYLGIGNDEVLNKSRSRTQDLTLQGKINSFLSNNQFDKALELIDWFIELRMKRGPSQDETSSVTDVFLLETCISLNQTKAVQFLYNRLKDCRYVTTSGFGITCTSLHLGRAAELLGLPDDALNHYKDALQVATAIHYRPEIAITRYRIARLLLKKDPEEKKPALEHLEFAINEFREMKMQPFLERALRHKEILKA
jgi:serine/threonine protein kinase/tetratricopeptide (TPR) repeat protein